MQVFTQACQTRGLPGFEHEEYEPDEPEDEEDDPPKSPPKTNRKARALANTKAGDLEKPAEAPAEDDTAGSAPPGNIQVLLAPIKTDPPLAFHTESVNSKADKAGKSSTAKKPKPKADKYFHPDFPEIGPRPGDGTKSRATWEKRVIRLSLEKAKLDMELKAQVDHQVSQILGQVKARAEQLQIDQDVSRKASNQATELPRSLSSTTKDKGKASAVATEPGLKAKSTEVKQTFTQTQLAMIALVSSGQLGIESAQITLANLGEPGIPSDCFQRETLPVASGSGSGKHKSNFSPC